MNETLPYNYDIYSPEEDLKKLQIEINNGTTQYLPWNPKIGTIIFIKQIHTIPDIDPEHPQYKQILLNQKRIHTALKRMWATDIFVEWITSDFILPNWDSSPLREILNEIKKYFDGWQELILQELGWAFLYILENPNVRVHITESAELNQEISINNKISTSSKMNERREQFTIQAVKEFLDKNPWKRVIVVYGFLHNFEDNIKSLYPRNPPAREIRSFHKIIIPPKK